MAKKIEAATEATEIMVANPTTGEMVNAMDLMSADMDELMDELDGVGSLTLDNIKVPSGGVQFFEVCDQNGESQPAKTIDCVVVFHSANNVYFSRPFDGDSGDNMPDCSSSDGKVGVLTDTGATMNCAKCRYNQFGSSGAGKACSNRMKLYILRDGMEIPECLNLPTTSVKAFKNYLGNIVTRKRKKLCFVKTRIGLEQKQSKSGIKYSACTFGFVDLIDPADAAKMLEWRETCKGINDASNHYAESDTEQDSGDDLTVIESDLTDPDMPF